MYWVGAKILRIAPLMPGDVKIEFLNRIQKNIKSYVPMCIAGTYSKRKHR